MSAYVTKKSLSRRTALKAMGVTIGLPMLDAMVPARTAWAKTAAADAPRRLVAMEMVHGAAGMSPFGATNNLWVPAQVGRRFDLTPTSLSPLEPFRDHITIISHTDVRNAEALSAPEIGGDHYRSSAVMFTQAHPRQTQGNDVQAGTSMDQIFARRFGQATPIPSMQLTIESVDQTGGCLYGYSCIYTDTISWASATQPLPMVRDPRVVFDQLFGTGATPEERAASTQANRSILDWVTAEVTKIRREIGRRDQMRFDEYLETVREIERRIQQTEMRNAASDSRALPSAPMGVPDSFEEHVHLMMDLIALAFQADTTRVFSFKLARDASSRAYPESGVNVPFHGTSHHGGNETKIKELATINKYHVSMVPYLLDKLKKSVEGDATILDNSLIIYGSPMSDPNVHNHSRCPLFIAGHAGGSIKGGLHVKAPDGTPMANAMLSMLEALGHDDMTAFGDSTAALDLNKVETAAGTTAQD
jgi:hypothetical protein